MKTRIFTRQEIETLITEQCPDESLQELSTDGAALLFLEIDGTEGESETVILDCTNAKDLLETGQTEMENYGDGEWY